MTQNDETLSQAYTIVSLYVFLVAWAIHRYRDGHQKSICSGLMIALLDFPIEWANEKWGLFWSVDENYSAYLLRSGFPIEVPLLFFLGGSTLPRIFPKDQSKSSSFIERGLPALLCGVGGAIGEKIFNKLNLMEWKDCWDYKGVFLLYSVGCFLIFQFHDMNDCKQKKCLLLLMSMAVVTFPHEVVES